MIRVPAFIGMRDNKPRPKIPDETAQLCCDFREIDRRLLVDDSKAAPLGRLDTRYLHRPVEFELPLPGIVFSGDEPIPASVFHVPRRAISHVNEDGVAHSRKLSAQSDHFIIRMRRDHNNHV